MNTTIFDIKGNAGEKVNLPASLFGTTVPGVMIAQAVRVFLSNQRKARAKTKTRSDVVMTTAKMYRQKGTGRARHGSYSAPVFVGGAIAHGPRGNQNYKMDFPEKMRRAALKGALAEKANTMIVISGKDSTGKTQEARQFIKTTKQENKNILLVVGKAEVQLARSWGNLNGVKVVRPNQLNAYVLLKSNQLIMSEAALAETEKLYAN